MKISFAELYNNSIAKDIVDGINTASKNSRLSEADTSKILKILSVPEKNCFTKFCIITPNGKTTENSTQQAFVDLVKIISSNEDSFQRLKSLGWFYDKDAIAKITNVSKRYGTVSGFYVYKDAEVPLLMVRAIRVILDTSGQDALSQYSFQFEIKADSENPDVTVITPNSTDDKSSEADVHFTVKESIENIKAYIAARGFSYDGNLIENFYLSLKSKPFVILAGTSGTGKTRLAKLFAEAIDAEFKLVPVRPDWSDSTDLFGHVNLSGKFVPGAVLDYIKNALNNPKRPYFLCLDEMNLARVEYYLSDFLSVIETRDKNSDGAITSDPLVDIDRYGLDEDAKKKYGEVPFPENLYVVGTVNMDETTFPFSRKVLDRANTIEFSFVDLLSMPNSQTEKLEKFHLNNSFLKTEYLLLSDCNDTEDFIQGVCQELQTINTILQTANAHVGYRVRDEITFYMLNNKNAELMSRDAAMDNEIMQKILPRIQGSSMSIKEMLCELFKHIAGDFDGTQTQSDTVWKKMLAVAEQAGCRYPNAAKKIAFMVRRFDEDGFTSYWI